MTPRVEPYVIEFEIVHESQRSRYPSGWIPVITTDKKNRRDAYRILRAQGHHPQTLKNRRWRVAKNPDQGLRESAEQP